MTEELALLDDTARSIFDRHCTREARAEAAGDVPAELWRVLDDSGLPSLATPEGGGGLPELVVLAWAVGRAAAPVPLVEMAGVASWLLTAGGLPLPDGITTSATADPRDELRLTRRDGGWSATGVLHRVPWGAAAQQVVALADSEDGPHVVVLSDRTRVDRGRNHAGEPRDTVHLEDAAVATESVAPVDLTPGDLRRRGALLRSASMAGAMEQVLAMTVAHAAAREQFGRPLSAFQAIQHHLVAIAEESVCTAMAVRAAAVAGDGSASLGAAAAKATAGRAASVVAARAHQVHGAIGTTQEHSLHWFTTRLWSWQDEFGSASHWAGQIGRDVLAADASSLWPRISASVGDGAVGERGSPTLTGQS
jgi:acyl-CoA dehydrogenase